MIIIKNLEYKKNYSALNKFNKRILFKSGLALGSNFMNVTFLYDRTSLLEMNRSYTALENKSFLYKIPQRNMMRGVSNIIRKPCIVNEAVPLNYTIKRHMPGQGYSIHEIKKNIIGKDPKTGQNIYENYIKTATGQEVPQHEKAHVIVRDNETGKDIAILTSAKNLLKGNVNIAPENYKGEKLPNGQPKAQQMRFYEMPRDTRTCKNIVLHQQATAFAKKYDKEIDAVVKQTNTHMKPAILRVDEDSSLLYHPDGRPIFDVHGQEINYND